MQSGHFAQVPRPRPDECYGDLSTLAEMGLRCDLENRSLEASTASKGRSVEIAVGAEDKAGVGVLPIGAAAEQMQRCLRPAPARGTRQFEHTPAARKSPLGGRAVEVTSSIEDQADEQGVCSTSVSVEVVQHLLHPDTARLTGHLENGSAGWELEIDA